MEEDISRCFNLSHALRQYSVHSLPSSCHSCGWGSRLLDRWFSSSCTFGDGWSTAVRQRVGRHFCPIPRNLAHRQISSCEACLLSTFAVSRPHPLIPSPRGPVCNRLFLSASPCQAQRRLRWAIGLHPALELVRVYWDTGTLYGGRDEAHCTSIVVPIRWYTLPEAHIGVVPRGRYSAIDSTCRKVLSYRGISRNY